MSDGPTRLRSCVSFCGVCLSVSVSVSLCVYVRSSEVAGAANPKNDNFWTGLLQAIAWRTIRTRLHV